MSAPHILVVGAGSVGRRHAKNFGQLGARVSCFDPREDRRAQVRDEFPALVTAYDRFDTAIAQPHEFDGVVIASPPHVHIEQTLACVQQNLPVLLEKPLAPTLQESTVLESVIQQTQVPVLLGYTYRWWPPLNELRKQLPRVGQLRHARFVMSAHLADWHPWERYQDFFMASREMGGGALLDESHFIDLMIWLFGIPRAIMGRVEHLSTLEITTDDNVDLLCTYDNNFRVTIHLDLYGRPHEKMITVVGEEGTLHCLFDPNVVRYSKASVGEWEETGFNSERNDMFLSEAQAFLNVLAGETPSCTVADGVRVLQCVEAARRSTVEGRVISIDDIC